MDETISSRFFSFTEHIKSKSPGKDFTINLTELAKVNNLPTFIGRKEELEHSLTILCRKKFSNVLFIGETGVGKSTVINGIAEKIAFGKAPGTLLDSVVLKLNIKKMENEATGKDDFQILFADILNDLHKQSFPIILFLDEFLLLKPGIADILKCELERETIHFAASMDINDYKKKFMTNNLDKYFQKVVINEPSDQECVAIVNIVAERYAEYYRIRYEQGVIDAIVGLSSFALEKGGQPGRAIRLLDECCKAAVARSAVDGIKGIVRISDAKNFCGKSMLK